MLYTYTPDAIVLLSQTIPTPRFDRLRQITIIWHLTSSNIFSDQWPSLCTTLASVSGLRTLKITLRVDYTFQAENLSKQPYLVDGWRSIVTPTQRELVFECLQRHPNYPSTKFLAWQPFDVPIPRQLEANSVTEIPPHLHWSSSLLDAAIIEQ